MLFSLKMERHSDTQKNKDKFDENTLNPHTHLYCKDLELYIQQKENERGKQLPFHIHRVDLD